MRWGDEYWAYFESKVPDGPKRPYPRPPGAKPFSEHIACVKCTNGHGFNGNRISAEEMRLCNTSQYIVKKVSDMQDLPEWTPEPDDEDFERESKYFLSGLADGTAEVLEGDCAAYPERHGLEGEVMQPQGYTGFADGDLVFLPHCLEIYKRVSALRLDSAELTHVPEFADWWTSDGMINSPPLHKSVRACVDQWFQHTPGNEFIAADPLQVPALTAIFEAARRPDDFDAMKLSPLGGKETNGTNIKLRHLCQAA